MTKLRKALLVLLPVLGVVTLALAGCKPETKSGGGAQATKPAGSGAAAGGGTPKPAGGGGTLEVKAYNATLKGRIVYNGDEEPKIEEKPTNKPSSECPATVLGAGWYTKDSSDKKGIKYAVVFIRPVGGRLPKVPENVAKPAVDIVEMRQPKCQFEPRVLVMGPGQKLKFYNDSDPKISHDANLSGPTSINKTLPPGETVIYDPDADNSQPYKVICNQHSGFMSGWVWRFDHPWAAVTDADGKFEIKNVPVLSSGKLAVVIWHELLPGDNRMQFAEIELKDGEVKDLGTIGIPKPTKAS
jgi:hypothetical protein